MSYRPDGIARPPFVLEMSLLSYLCRPLLYYREVSRSRDRPENQIDNV